MRSKWAAGKAVRAGLAVGGSISEPIRDRRATKHPAKIRAALRVGAAPAPRRVAGSLNRTSAIRLASALRVIRRRSQRCYTSLRLGALGLSCPSTSDPNALLFALCTNRDVSYCPILGTSAEYGVSRNVSPKVLSYPLRRSAETTVGNEFPGRHEPGEVLAFLGEPPADRE